LVNDVKGRYKEKTWRNPYKTRSYKGFDVEFPVRLSYLKNQITKRECDSAEYLERNNYYTIPADSNDTFLSMLKESCFWSSSLYRECLKADVFRIMITLALFTVLIISASLLYQSPDTNFSIQRALLVIIGTLPVWQSIKGALKFNIATNKLKDIDSELEAKPQSISELLLLFSEYGVITSATPLIPDELYLKHQAKIQENWDTRQVSSN
jgi:hypothetical protein